ncbi:MAG: hypothetical protein IT379_11905 [Deltaproteobacteria bacterium]|nr:hypothetical protein [Deltaproteobacteria bacterium]
MTETSERLAVLAPIERPNNRTTWLRVGTAFRNKDGSINVYLDAYPVNGKLQLRVMTDRDPDHGQVSERRIPSAA